jgi:hypothetical protein
MDCLTGRTKGWRCRLMKFEDNDLFLYHYLVIVWLKTGNSFYKKLQFTLDWLGNCFEIVSL